MPMRSMLRIYFMQQWYALSDPWMEDATYDTTSLRLFAGLELGKEAMQDETTILNFRAPRKTYKGWGFGKSNIHSVYGNTLIYNIFIQ